MVPAAEHPERLKLPESLQVVVAENERTSIIFLMPDENLRSQEILPAEMRLTESQHQGPTQALAVEHPSEKAGLPLHVASVRGRFLCTLMEFLNDPLIPNPILNYDLSFLVKREETK